MAALAVCGCGQSECGDCGLCWWPGDRLKGIELGDCLTLYIGGLYRCRCLSERNHKPLGLTGNDDDFLLHRLRLHGDLKYGPDYTHFDYAEPAALKGGKLRLAASGGFDSLNNGPYSRTCASIAWRVDTQ